MDFQYAGEIAAMGTVLCWTGSSLCFEAAGKRIGSLLVNIIRMVVAAALLGLTVTITRGSPIPWDFPPDAWFWLGLSGLIGFTLADMMLFQAFVEIGPRVATLIMTLAPPLTALIGWLFLGETYAPLQWLGIAVTLAGIAWVVVDGMRLSGGPAANARHITVRGTLLSVGAAIGQAITVVMSKHGMGNLDPFAATQIRVIAGTVGFAVLFLVIGFWPRVWRSLSDRRAMGLTALGALIGPFLGVSLLMVSLHYISTGITATFTALVPVTLIPIVIVIHKERISTGSILGTLLAVAGVSLLVSH